MPDLPHSAERQRLVSRRLLLRGALLLSGGTALLTACAPSASPPSPPPRKEAVAPTALPTRPSETPRPAAQATPIVPSVPGPASAASRTGGAPRTGGTLIVGRSADATDLDPQLTSSVSRQRMTMLTYNNLVKLSNEMAILPDLAETWKVSADGKQIEFTLRRGVLWHPPVSREVTADDVKLSYERLIRDSPGKADFSIVDGIEVLDRYNVRFVLHAANAGLLASMADSRWGAIVNRETLERYGDLRRVAVGTGPFILEAWQQGQEMTLRRNPDYFEKGKPYIEKLVVKIVPDEASLVVGLRDGTLHHAMLEDHRGFEYLKDQPGLQAHRTPRTGFDFLNVNQRVAPFNKPEVIEAINYAVDRDECIMAAAGGYAVQTAPCTPPMKQWLLPDELWKPYYRVDLERAKASLARAGHPNGFAATVLTIPTFHTMSANAQVIQANLKRIGIDLRVESVEYGQWLQRWRRKEFEATLNTTAGYADPDSLFYRAFHSKAQNWNNVNSPELDRLLDEGRAVFEVEKRKPIYDKVQLRLLARPGHFYLFTPEMIDFTQMGVQGFSQHPTTTLWNYQNVWLAE